jgi:hypothetical protein
MAQVLEAAASILDPSISDAQVLGESSSRKRKISPPELPVPTTDFEIWLRDARQKHSVYKAAKPKSLDSKVKSSKGKTDPAISTTSPITAYLAVPPEVVSHVPTLAMNSQVLVDKCRAELLSLDVVTSQGDAGRHQATVTTPQKKGVLTASCRALNAQLSTLNPVITLSHKVCMCRRQHWPVTLLHPMWLVIVFCVGTQILRRPTRTRGIQSRTRKSC